jgi:hypothetical protein
MVNQNHKKGRRNRPWHGPTGLVKLEVYCYNPEDRGSMLFLNMYPPTSLHSAITKTIIWRTPALKIWKLIKPTRLNVKSWIYSKSHCQLQIECTVFILTGSPSCLLRSMWCICICLQQQCYKLQLLASLYMKCDRSTQLSCTYMSVSKYPNFIITWNCK